MNLVSYQYDVIGTWKQAIVNILYALVGRKDHYVAIELPFEVEYRRVKWMTVNLKTITVEATRTHRAGIVALTFLNIVITLIQLDDIRR